MSEQLVTVTATYTNIDGTPSRGTVSLTPVQVAGNGEPDKRLVMRHSVVGNLDRDGRLALEVLASDDPGWNIEGGIVYYEIREYVSGARGRAYLVLVPGPGPVDLFDLQPIEAEIQTLAPYPVPGPPGALEDAHLDDLVDVDTSRDATGMVITRQPDGTYKGAHVRIGLNQLTDVTVLPSTPPNSLLGTVGEGTTPGVAEWEGLHLDYIQAQVLGPLPSTVADIGQRVTELEHTGEIVPPDLELTVDLYSGSFTRIMGCDPVTASPSKRIRLSLATVPGPNGAIFASLSDISGTGAVWADFGGTIGKVVDTSGTSINGAALKEAIRRGQIVTVHRGSDGSHPTLVAERVENPADLGSSLSLDALKDVTAPANTPTGKVLGTTAVGAWGPVDTDALRGPVGPAGPAGPGIRILSAVATANDLPSTGNQPGDAHLVTATGNLHVWNGTGWTEIGHVQGPPGPAGPLDILTDVDVSAAAAGSILTKMPNGTWMGRPNAISSLDSLSDVTAPASTPANKVLGTTAVGTWGPVPNPVPSIGPPDAGKVLTVSGTAAVWAAPAVPRAAPAATESA
jgi:hypothetical protein